MNDDLPPDWEALDSERSYYAAIRAVAEAVAAGEPLHEMFVPRDRSTHE